MVYFVHPGRTRQPFCETLMANVSIDADIKVKWPQGQSSYSPGNPEELAIIGVDLLVKELGTQAAMLFISQVFERYSPDQTVPDDRLNRVVLLAGTPI